MLSLLTYSKNHFVLNHIQSKLKYKTMYMDIPGGITGVSQCDVANAQIVIGSQDSHGIAQGMATFKP